MNGGRGFKGLLKRLVGGDHEDLKALVEPEVVLAGFAVNILGLEDAGAFGLFLMVAAGTAPGRDSVLDLRGFVIRRLVVCEGGGACKDKSS